jgi:D-glycero-D-manno-heptose 1,7-bisphosphate phosphatase
MAAPDAIILDRDGVINEIVFRENRPVSPRSLQDFIIREDFREFYLLIAPLPIRLFAASNQPDIRRGNLTVDVLEGMTDLIRNEFPKIEEIVYCCHDDADKCSCRKPKPGLLIGLRDKYNLASDKTYFVGDSRRDILAGAELGFRTVFLAAGYNQESLQKCNPQIIVHNLVELTHVWGKLECHS